VYGVTENARLENAGWSKMQGIYFSINFSLLVLNEFIIIPVLMSLCMSKAFHSYELLMLVCRPKSGTE